MDLYDHQKISVILAGKHYLKDILGQNHPAYVGINNSFSEWHEFSALTSKGLAMVIEHWEQTFLTRIEKLSQLLVV